MFIFINRHLTLCAAMALATLFSVTTFADQTVFLNAGTARNGATLSCPPTTLQEVGSVAPGSYLPETLILNGRSYAYETCVRYDQDGCFNVYTSADRRHHLLYDLGALIVADSEDFFGAKGCGYDLKDF